MKRREIYLECDQCGVSGLADPGRGVATHTIAINATTIATELCDRCADKLHKAFARFATAGRAIRRGRTR